MASISTVTESVNHILSYVKDNPGCSQDAVVEEVLKVMKVKGDYNVTFPLQALVAAKVLTGTTRQRKLFSLRVGTFVPSALAMGDPIEPSAPSEPMVPKSVLERAMAKFKNDVEIINAALDEARRQAAAAMSKERIVKVVIEKPGKKPKEFEETYHNRFEDILTLANLRENIFLYGPMGSGKTFIGGQLARHLDLPFSFVSCSSGLADSVLTGMLYPFGEMGKFEFAESEFLKRYENGGVYLIDEMDRADPNLLIVINAALAGDQLAIPKRRENPYAQKHPNFVCIAAANTLGTGADRMYTSANKLDASTMDRFAIGKVLIDYDENVEKVLCPDDELRERLTKYRKAIDANRLERGISSRFMEKAYKLKHSKGWSHERIDESLFLGWREDERNKVVRF